MPILDLGLLNRQFIVRVPIGTIVIWSGTIDDIPKGWHLCDGEDDTPDLRDKFVSEANNTYKFCYIMKLAFDDTDKGSNIYSKEEMVVGTWIDGKPLYRVAGSVLTPTETEKWVNMGVPKIENLKDIVSIRASYSNGLTRIMPIPNMLATSKTFGTQICYNTQSGGIDLYIPSTGSYTGILCSYIIEYTKTID